MIPGHLILVGASVRPLAWSSYRLGWHCTAIDLFADQDTARYAAAIPISRWSLPSIQAAWPQSVSPAILYTGGIENYPEILDWLADQGTLWGNHSTIVRAARDWGLLSRLAHEVGLRVPEVRPSGGDSLPLDHFACTTGWLWKPLRSAGGRGIRRVRGTMEIPSPEVESGYWQREVPGIPHSAQCFADAEAAHLVGFARQWIAEDWAPGGGFHFSGGTFPITVPAMVEASLRQLAQRGHSLGLRGWFGLDFMLDGDSAWILEINPRPTAMGELIERALGISIVASQGQAFAGEGCIEPMSWSFTEPADCWGKAIVYADRVCLAGEFPLEDSSLADLPAPGTRFQPGQPVCTVLAHGSESVMVQSALAERMRAVRDTYLLNDV